MLPTVVTAQEVEVPESPRSGGAPTTVTVGGELLSLPLYVGVEQRILPNWTARATVGAPGVLLGAVYGVGRVRQRRREVGISVIHPASRTPQKPAQMASTTS